METERKHTPYFIFDR